MNSEYYHIVVATDDNYAIHTRTLIRSIKVNESHPIKIWILGFNISECQKAKFNQLVDSTLQIEIVPLNNSILKKRLFKGIEVSADRSLATYARLLIPELLPPDISRCVYMDVDAIILSSIAPMYNIDLSGYAAAGVIDTNPISRHLAVGLSSSDIYINAGMIIWNLDWCRKNDVVAMFAQFIYARNGQIDAMDQGTFNGALSKYILTLPPKFNALTSFFQLNANDINCLWGGKLCHQKDIEDARKSPIFVHFTPNNTTRPWVRNCKHPLRKKYWSYREDNKSAVLQPDNRPLKLKVLSMLFYILPVKVYRALTNLR